MMQADLTAEPVISFAADLASIVSRHLFRTTLPANVEYRPSTYSSWYETGVLTFTFETGEVRQVFLKNFSRYRQPKQGMEKRRERELFIYRDVLDQSLLGTAQFCGALWSSEDGRYWLLIEYVNAEAVRYREFDVWPAAVRWLARMHAAYAPRLSSLSTTDKLLRYDAVFFKTTLESALRAVHSASPDLGRRLAGIARVHEEAVQGLAASPATLVHGAFLPFQVLVDESATPIRICPVDWELAGIGSFAYDLAFFCDGFKGAQLQHLLDAYQSEAESHGFEAPRDGDLRRLIACGWLYKNLRSLGQCVDRAYSRSAIEKLVEHSLEAARLVEGGEIVAFADDRV